MNSRQFPGVCVTSARAGLLGNMAAKHAKEMYGREQVLAYRGQVPRCGRVLESFLRYSDKLLFINKCYLPCFSSMFIFEAWLIQCSILQRLEIQNLHPKQMLIGHSRQHNRDIPSAAIA